MGLDAVEFIMDIENEFSIQIPDEDAPGLGVVGDLARYVSQKSLQRPGNEVTFEQALRTIIDILDKRYGIPKGYVNSTSHVVNGLGMD